MNGGSLQVSVGVKATGSTAPPGTAPSNTIASPTTTVAGGVTQSLGFGNSSGNADTECVGEYVLAASASLTLDLYTGTDLPNVFGAAGPLRVVKGLVVVIRSGGDTSGVRLGGAAANEWVGFFDAAGNKRKIFPGGPPFADGSPAGVAVTPTTKNFKIENLSALVAVQVRVYAAGNSVAPGTPIGLLLGLTYP